MDPQDDFDDLCEAIDYHLGPPGILAPQSSLPPPGSLFSLSKATGFERASAGRLKRPGNSGPKLENPCVMLQQGQDLDKSSTANLNFASDVNIRSLLMTDDQVTEQAERKALIAQLKTLAEETARLSRGLGGSRPFRAVPD